MAAVPHGQRARGGDTRRGAVTGRGADGPADAGRLANKQIARRLGISERTVKTHLTSVSATIGVADRTAAALWAERHHVTREG